MLCTKFCNDKLSIASWRWFWGGNFIRCVTIRINCIENVDALIWKNFTVFIDLCEHYNVALACHMPYERWRLNAHTHTFAMQEYLFAAEQMSKLLWKKVDVMTTEAASSRRRSCININMLWNFHRTAKWEITKQKTNNVHAVSMGCHFITLWNILRYAPSSMRVKFEDFHQSVHPHAHISHEIFF